MNMFFILTRAFLDTSGSESVLDVGVVHHLVADDVIDFRRRTGVLTGSIIVEVPAGLHKETRNKWSWKLNETRIKMKQRLNMSRMSVS